MATALPLLSVIVPAKDEEQRIGMLLRSLETQDYPDFEIVFVNDRSRDGTGRLLREFAAACPGRTVRIVDLTENPGPNFKKFALGKGLELARGELVLFTDADCEFGPGWIRAMASRLADPAAALAIGPVFKLRLDNSFFQLFQAIDHAIRYLYLAGSTGLGLAGGGFGNNLIFRRSALEACGGYGAVPYSITEDAALISLMRTKRGGRIRAALEPAARVMTLPVTSWADLIRQGLRWNNGGMFANDILTSLSYTLLMLSISAGILLGPLVPFIPALWPFPVAILTAMVLNLSACCVIARGTLPSPWRWFLLHLVLIPSEFTLLTILSVVRAPVSWKEERMTINVGRNKKPRR